MMLNNQRTWERFEKLPEETKNRIARQIFSFTFGRCDDETNTLERQLMGEIQQAIHDNSQEGISFNFKEKLT